MFSPSPLDHACARLERSYSRCRASFLFGRPNFLGRPPLLRPFSRDDSALRFDFIDPRQAGQNDTRLVFVWIWHFAMNHLLALSYDTIHYLSTCRSRSGSFAEGFFGESFESGDLGFELFHVLEAVICLVVDYESRKFVLDFIYRA